MQIIENKALLLNLKNPQRVTTIIPKSRDMGNGQVLVNWGLDEVQVLKNLKIGNVPSPITAHYDWPGQYRPFDHQKQIDPDGLRTGVTAPYPPRKNGNKK